MVEREELAEEDLLVVVFDRRVLLQEKLLKLVQLHWVDLLKGVVDVELGVPATTTLLQHHGGCLDLGYTRQAVLQTIALTDAIIFNGLLLLPLVGRWVPLIVPAPGPGLLRGWLRV